MQMRARAVSSGVAGKPTTTSATPRSQHSRDVAAIFPGLNSISGCTSMRRSFQSPSSPRTRLHQSHHTTRAPSLLLCNGVCDDLRRGGRSMHHIQDIQQAAGGLHHAGSELQGPSHTWHTCRPHEGAHHDWGVPVAEHIAAHVQQAAAEVVAILVQCRDLARAAVRAVLAAHHLQRGDDLLRCRRRHARRIVVPWRHAPQVCDQVPAPRVVQE